MKMHSSMEVPQPPGNVYSPQVPAQPMHSVSPMGRPPPNVHYGPPLEYKVYDINRRLRQRPDYPDRWWWEQFALEFFDDTATMLISFYTPGEGEKHYTIGRAMIPQYFSSIFEGGVSEMYFTFSFAREYMSHSGPTLECDNALTTTQYHQPSFARILVESKLSFQCTFDESVRIRSWNQYLIRHKEYVPREIISLNLQENGSVEPLLPNITHLGLNNCVLNFLNVSAISGAIRNDMKPGYVGMLPGECMQQQQAWAPAGTPTDQVPQPHSVMSSHPSSNQPITQQMSEIAQSPVTSHNADSVNSADRMYMTKSPKPAKTKKRGRKGSAAKESPSSPKKSLKTPPQPNMNVSITALSPVSRPPLSQQMPGQQDVMIVGEPILMGGELGDEDERRITRLENNNNTDYMSPPPPSHQPSLSQPPQQQAVSAHHTTQQLNHTDMSIQSTVSNTATTAAVALINGDTDGNGLSLDLSMANTNPYDEPSISAALDALDQDANALAALP